MSKTARILMLMLILGISVACSIPVRHSDPFYSAWEEWGKARFPLIKPYEVYFAEGFEWWNIDLDFGLQYERSSEMKFYMSIKDVQKVAVQNAVIMIYSPYEQKRDNFGTQKVLYWFVIVPGETEDTNDDIVRGFDNETDFLDFVKGYEIKNITWESPEDINSKFVWAGCLEWILGCE